MVKEAINFLAPSRGGIYVDCTLGGGGHSREILKVLNGKGTLIGIDQDSEAIKKANAELGNFKNFKAIKDKFENIGSILDACGIPSIDGCLFDLGVSSRQFDNPTRGFSFRFEAKLDMRMDLSDATTAFDLINKLSAKELSDIFKEYGEEQHAKAIAADIETMRKLRPIQTTSQLAELIERRVRFRSAGKRSIHPATKAFMALRIAVNRELQQIETALNVLVKRMNANGIIVAISYHSLEDRIIKNIFREMFEKLGIDLNGDFNNCKNIPLINEIFGDQELQRQYREILDNEIICKIKACPSLQDAIKTLRQNDVMDESCVIGDLYDLAFNTYDDCGFIQLVPTSDGYKFICVTKNALTLSNHVLFHELNHICEMAVLNNSDEKIDYKTGFSTLDYYKNVSKFDYKEVINYLQNMDNSYENDQEKQAVIAFNEVVNDYITISIDKIAKQMGLNFSLNENQAITSCYRVGFPLLKKFIEQNIDILKTFRMMPNPTAFRDLIGHDDYDRLAKSTMRLLDLNTFSINKLYQQLFLQAGYIMPRDITNYIWDIVHEDGDWSPESDAIVEIYKTVESVTNNIKDKLKNNNIYEKEEMQ